MPSLHSNESGNAPATAGAPATGMQSGIETIDPDDGPPPPVTMTDAASMDEDEIAKRSARRSGSAGLVLMDDDDDGPPAAGAAGGEDAIKKSKAKSIARPRIRSPAELRPFDDESLVYPTREEIEDEVAYESKGGDEELPSGVSGTASGIAVTAENSYLPHQTVTSPAAPEYDREAVHVPVAWAVDEGDGESGEGSDEGVVIAAEPLLPWWKQRRVRLLLATVLAIVAALSISLGVALSSDPPVTNPAATVIGESTSPPSQSLAPSSSPSACTDTIYAQVQTVDLLGDGPSYPNMAVDGDNMIVVTMEARSSAVYTAFYALTNGEWVVKNSFQEDYLHSDYSVALSGNTAFVGLPRANEEFGAVSVYERNKFGDWEKVNEPFVHDADAYHCLTGGRVEVGGDLACVRYGGYTFYVYRRDGKKWVQAGNLGSGNVCSIFGNTIAIPDSDYVQGQYQPSLQLYEFDREQGQLLPRQDPIPTRDVMSMSLSRDYLVIKDEEAEVHVYRREPNETYIFHQRLNVTLGFGGSYYGKGNQVALDNDVLVLGGNNHSHIFAERNGYWEEEIILDESFWYYDISGRSLLATNSWGDEDVYFYNIEQCAQDRPTAQPSLSIAPTICYPLDIHIVYDRNPTDTSWELRRTDTDGDFVALRSYQEHDENATSYSDAMCVQEGEYEFIIFDLVGYDLVGDGICCDDGEGSYKVTTNGELVAQGGEFGIQEATKFFLPPRSQPPSSYPSTGSGLIG